MPHALPSDELVERFLAQTDCSFGEARPAPRACYTDEGFHERELETIFRREWIVVGRAGEIPAAGDYLAETIAGQPIVVIRQEGGGVRAFANSCLHRFAKLLDGKGNASRFACPYHAWTYDLEGQLVGAPYVENVREFCAGKRLPELPCTLWHGFILVTLDADAPPPDERLAGLDALLAEYRLADFEDRCVDDLSFDCNWKALVENYNESYHLFKVHRASGGEQLAPTRLVEDGPGDANAFVIHYTPLDPAEEVTTFNTSVGAESRRRLAVVGLLPNGLMTIFPDLLWWVSIQPDGVGRVRLHWGTSYGREWLAAQDDPDKSVREFKQLIDMLNAEDKQVLTAVQAGTGGTVDAPGCYVPLERQLYLFNRYLASRLRAGS